MAPRAGEGGRGSVILGLSDRGPVVHLRVRGLEPTARGDIYVVWAYDDDEGAAFPLAQETVAADGAMVGEAPMQPGIIEILSDADEVRLSRAGSRETQAALDAAVQDETFPAFTGQLVMSGPMPSLDWSFGVYEALKGP
jgi:hypothetical protein